MRDFKITKYGAGGCKPHENGRYVLISDVIDKLDLMLDNEYNTLACIKLFKKVLTCSPKESCEVKHNEP